MIAALAAAGCQGTGEAAPSDPPAALQVGRFFCASTTAAGAGTGALGSCDTRNGKLRIKIRAQADVD